MRGSVVGDDVDVAKLDSVGALVVDRHADWNVLLSVDLLEKSWTQSNELKDVVYLFLLPMPFMIKEKTDPRKDRFAN